MFFNRSPRGRERQAIMDELVDLDPDERQVRLDSAVAEGRISFEERVQILRIFDRLENLRIMMVPSVMKWPEDELIGGTLRPAMTEAVVKLPSTYDRSELIGIPIESQEPAVKVDLQALTAPGEQWPSIAWLRPDEAPARQASRQAVRRAARRQSNVKPSGRPEQSRRPVRSR